MRYVIEGKFITFDKQDEIGSGGEAVIFRLADKAVKIYRDPKPGRAKKLQHFLKEGFVLPDNITAPLSLVYEEKNQNKVVGFTMKKVTGAVHPVALLASRNFCNTNKVTTKDVVELFLKGCNTLELVHEKGLVIGDLNDQNELVNLQNSLDYWIDVDSWQVGGYPCRVATQDYLHPDLYRIDLSVNPVFEKKHDWYSFVVLLFRSILRVHPFRGVHQKFKSLMACAENKVTVLDPGMVYPKIGLPPDLLTDDLAEVLLKYLKREETRQFPIDKLREYGDVLVECHSCNTWYPGTRGNCPNCSAKSLVDMRLAARIAGCEQDTLLVTNGRIVFFHMAGTTVYCLADENNVTVLYKKSKGHNQVRKELFNTRPGASYSMFEENLVMCADPFAETPVLYVLDVSGNSPKPIFQTTTQKLAGKGAVFGCSQNHIYRMAGTMLMRGELFAKTLLEREVMQVLPQQTWFRVSPSKKEALVGFYRVFGEMKWFSVLEKEDNKFQRVQLPIEELVRGESLIDVSVKFSENKGVVLRRTRSRGVDSVRVDVMSLDDRKVEDSYKVRVCDCEVFESVHGKAYKKGVLLHPTDKGIVQETMCDQKRQTIKSTSQFVQEDDMLYPHPEGIVVVKQDRVLLLKPKKQL